MSAAVTNQRVGCLFSMYLCHSHGRRPRRGNQGRELAGYDPLMKTYFVLSSEITSSLQRTQHVGCLDGYLGVICSH